MKNTLVCNECGGTNIQITAWVDPNTNEYIGECGTDNEDKWCEDCQDFIGFDLIEKND